MTIRQGTPGHSSTAPCWGSLIGPFSHCFLGYRSSPFSAVSQLPAPAFCGSHQVAISPLLSYPPTGYLCPSLHTFFISQHSKTCFLLHGLLNSKPEQVKVWFAFLCRTGKPRVPTSQEVRGSIPVSSLLCGTRQSEKNPEWLSFHVYLG